MRQVPKDKMFSPRVRRRIMRRLAVGCAAGCWIGAAQAAIVLSNPSAAAGQWDLSLADSNRTCRMTLRTDPAGNPMVSMPAGCRRSLPILAKVGTFEVPRADHIALADPSGNAVLDFAGTGQNFLAIGPEGETYQLVAVSGPFAESEHLAQATNPKPPGFQTVDPKAVQAKTAETAAVPSRITAAMKTSDLAGRYAVLRDGNKDTGCMITLDDKSRALKGGFKATLAPACRDQGIVIFDPMGWQLMAGRLVLTARKGHTTHLDLQPDSTWVKDPKEGKELGLKKLQ